MSEQPLADENAARADRGLVDMFKVERLVPSSRGGDHTGCRYFVLDPQHDAAALAALVRYEQVARSEGRFALANDLRQWAHDLTEAQRESSAFCDRCGGYLRDGICSDYCDALDCGCGRSDRTNPHDFGPGCDAWDDLLDSDEDGTLPGSEQRRG